MWHEMSKRQLEIYMDSCGFTTEGNPSEVEVLKLLRSGSSITACARRLNASERTISRRIRSIKNKIDRYWKEDAWRQNGRNMA